MLERRQRGEDDSDGSDAGDGSGGAGDATQVCDAGRAVRPEAGRPRAGGRCCRCAAPSRSTAPIIWTRSGSTRCVASSCCDARATGAGAGRRARTEAELAQLGRDLFSIDAKALEAMFRREREQERRERRAKAGEEEEEGEGVGARGRRRRSPEGAPIAKRSCAPTPRRNGRRCAPEDAPSVSRLNAQLEALEALRAAGGDADTIPRTTL